MSKSSKNEKGSSSIGDIVGGIGKAAKDAMKTSSFVGSGKKKAPGNELDSLMDQWSSSLYQAWDDVCDKVEETGNEKLIWLSENFLRRLSIEAPIVVGFTFSCVILHFLNLTILPGISKFFGVDDFFSPSNPLHYLRQVTHIFAHDSMGHLRRNITNILLVGPSSEAVFGHKNLVIIMLVVAVSSAWAHILIGPYQSRQLGASGVVFALILLNSLASAKRGKIPVSFVLTAYLWMADEFWKLFFSSDGVSHHAHLVGGIVGTAAGYIIVSQKVPDSESNQRGLTFPGFFRSQKKRD